MDHLPEELPSHMDYLPEELPGYDEWLEEAQQLHSPRTRTQRTYEWFQQSGAYKACWLRAKLIVAPYEATMWFLDRHRKLLPVQVQAWVDERISYIIPF